MQHSPSSQALGVTLKWLPRRRGALLALFSIGSVAALSCSSVLDSPYDGTWTFDAIMPGRALDTPSCPLSGQGSFSCTFTWRSQGESTDNTGRADGVIDAGNVYGDLTLSRAEADLPEAFTFEGTCPTLSSCDGSILDGSGNSAGTFRMQRQ